MHPGTIAAPNAAIGKPLLNWLSRHKRFTTVLAVVYLVVNVFTHGFVQHIAKWIQDRLTPDRTNTSVTIVALATLPLITAWIFVRVKHAPHKFLKVFYCAATADFVESVCGEYAEARKIHFVLDNLNTHWHERTCRVVAKLSRCPVPPIKTGSERKTFLASADKRIVFHFTPSHASWLNQIEIWFGTLVRKLIRRGNFTSVAELEDKIIEFIQYYDEHLAHPYRWTYTGKPLAANEHAA